MTEDVKRGSSKTLITPKGRLSFPHLFERNSGGNFPSDKYETMFLIPKTEDISGLMNEINLLLKDCFDGKIKDIKQLKHPPVRDGDAEGKYDGFWFLKAKSEYKPIVVGPNPEHLIDDEEEVYGGANAKLSINFFAYDMKGSKGIGVGLKNVQILGGGDRFGGGSGDPKTQFSNEGGASNDEDDYNI